MTSICSEEFVTTMGLPCAHMMFLWKETSIPLGAIHLQWRIDMRSSLLVDNDVGDGDDELTGLLSKLSDKYKKLPLIEREDTHEKVSQPLSCSVTLFFSASRNITLFPFDSLVGRAISLDYSQGG
ncbi:hypothetical protein OROMI_015411 [Orobanche minor]